MMKNILIVLISLSILASCTGNTIYEKPEDLIPKDSMILLLKDLYLASSAKGIKIQLVLMPPITWKMSNSYAQWKEILN